MSVVLSEHLPLLASAPDGIQKLRGLILELAVRGKLVPQDPNDEPACELLKRIAQERIRLDAAATRRKSKEAPTDRNNTPQIDLPSGWEWAPLGEVVEIVRGITFPSSEKSKSPEPGRVLCLRTSNVQDKIEWDDVLYIRSEFISRNDQYLIENDIVMSMANSRELVGKVALVDVPLAEQVTFGGFLGVLRPISISPKFLMAFLRAPTVRSSLIDSASQTTNIANISLGKLRPLEFPIPPLAEQDRIVAKVDELMALCDRLEAEQVDAASAHARLVETLLGTLTQSTDAADLAANWQRLAEHFDTLFTTEASIDALKQTVLQLAVMGKLVPQDPLDKPASELLKQIAGERARLEAEGVCKKAKPVAPVGEDERLFEMPIGWEWTRLGVAIELISGQHLTPDEYTDGLDDPIPYLTGPAEFGEISPTPSRSTRQTRAIAVSGDILLTVKGSGVGKLNRVSQSVLAISRQLMAVRPIIICGDFAELVLRSSEQHFQDKTVGIAIPGIGRDDVQGLVLGLPPLAEQYRIVAKVDELMSLCDRLKADLVTVGQRQATLTDTLIGTALEAA